MGLEQSATYWRKMIKQALKKNIKIILLTPSPDMNEKGNILDSFAVQINALAAEYKIGVVDSYKKFKEAVAAGKNIQELMSQSNHPNREGHQLIADEIVKYFE